MINSQVKSACGYSRTNRLRAFTLIELLVVISIIAILASIVLVSLVTVHEKGRIAAGLVFDSTNYHSFGDNPGFYMNFSEGPGGSTPINQAPFKGTVSVGNCPGGIGNSGCYAAYTAKGDTPSGQGYGFTFTGASPVIVTLPQPITLDKFTVSMWIRPTAYAPAILVNAYCQSAVAPCVGDNITDVTKLVFQPGDSTTPAPIGFGSRNNWFLAETSVPPNKWSLITFCFSNSGSRNYRLYIDGKPIAPAVYSGGAGTALPYGGNIDTIDIGSSFNGSIANVAIYSSSLCP